MLGLRKVVVVLLAILWSGTAIAEEGEERCVPQCEEKECGDDGCGDVCGTCEEGQECVAAEAEEAPSLCETPCMPQCEGNACGDDGCGGTCGTCEESEECVSGEGSDVPNVCEEVCVPECDGKTCGGNGCGGNCGECGEGDVCLGSTCIVAQCAGSCEGTAAEGCECDASCFLFGDCCADVCVTCGICEAPSNEPSPQEGCGEGTCAGCCDVFVLDATCQCDASCWEYDDCCEDSCETCGLCDEPTSVEQCPDWLSYEGCCSNAGELSYCTADGKKKGGPCPADTACGWNEETGYYDCVAEGAAESTGEFPQNCSELPGYEAPDGETVTQDASDSDAGGEEIDGMNEDSVTPDADGGNTSDDTWEEEVDADDSPNEEGGTGGLEDAVPGGTDAGPLSDSTASSGDETSELSNASKANDGCRQTSPGSLPFLLFGLTSLLWLLRRKDEQLGGE